MRPVEVLSSVEDVAHMRPVELVARYWLLLRVNLIVHRPDFSEFDIVPINLHLLLVK